MEMEDVIVYSTTAAGALLLIILITIYFRNWGVQEDKSLWKELWRHKSFLFPSTPNTNIHITILIFCLVATQPLNIYSTIYSKRILDSLSLNSTNDDGYFWSTKKPEKLEYRWYYIVAFAIGEFLQRGVLHNIEAWSKRIYEKEAGVDLQIRLFKHLHSLSLRWHLENRSGQVFDLIYSAPYLAVNLLNSIFYLIPVWLDMIVTFAYFFTIYDYILWIVVITTSILASTVTFILLKWRGRLLREYRDAEKETREVKTSSFENYETVKYFTNEDYELSKFCDAYEKQEGLSTKQDFVWEAYSFIDLIIQKSAYVIVMLIVVKKIVDNQDGLTIGDYMFFTNFMKKLTRPLEVTVSVYERLSRSILNVEKVAEVLELVPEIQDQPDAPELVLSGGSIKFNRVSFSYVPEREVLTDISFHVPPGHTTAIVGPSGSGKSTLLKLLFRFYDVSDGEILIDGQNIKTVTCKSLRRAIGVIPQDIVLFDETIRDNIKYGNIENCTEEDIISVAKIACLHEQIQNFPDGYETMVGSRGLKISGGEKQRVAIARALLKKPPILFFDEATSTLDTSTERQIQSSLKDALLNQTTIIIAHRLSTIVHADQILVLKDGRIVETGTHEELLSKENGLYTEMWNNQFKIENE